MSSDMFMAVMLIGVMLIGGLIIGIGLAIWNFLYTNSVRTATENPFEEIFCCLDKYLKITKPYDIQIVERRKKFIIVVQKTDIQSYDLLDIAKPLEIEPTKLKEIMIQYGAKERIVRNSWRSFENILCFETREKAQEFYDGYILSTLMCNKLIGKC